MPAFRAVWTFDLPEGRSKGYISNMASVIPTTVRSLSTADIRQYETDGYLVVEHLFDAALVDRIRREISAVVASPEAAEQMVQLEPAVASGELSPATPELGVRKLFRMALHNALFRELALHPGMRSIALALLGEDIKLMQSMLLMKPPHVSTEKVWHQDNAYFRLTPNHVVGFWVACDSADVANGCMHVIPGSHREGVSQHAGDGDLYGLVEQPAFDAETVVAIPLQPGDALVFHGELHHGTPANRTNTRRRALQYHYAASACRCEAEPVRKAEMWIHGVEHDDGI